MNRAMERPGGLRSLPSRSPSLAFGSLRGPSSALQAARWQTGRSACDLNGGGRGAVDVPWRSGRARVAAHGFAGTLPAQGGQPVGCRREEP
jgi:hypothetical protein